MCEKLKCFNCFFKILKLRNWYSKIVRRKILKWINERKKMSEMFQLAFENVKINKLKIE